MDSPAVALENSSGSLSVPPRLKLFLLVLLLQHQILNPEALQLSLLNFGGNLQQIVCPIEHAKNMFRLDFGPKHTKTRELMDAQACQEIIVFPN